MFGIYEFGINLTDIKNNLIYNSWYCGIYVDMKTANGTSDVNTEIDILNNTVDYSMYASMGFQSLEFAYFDCCYSGRLKINSSNQLVEGQSGQIGLFDIPHSDMSLALGMVNTSRSRFYHGWYESIPIGMPWPWQEDAYQKWTRLLWEHLGDGYNLNFSLFWVIGQQTDFGQYAPVNNYRIYGQGWLDDVTLSRW